MELNFGHADEDANNLSDLIKKDVKENGGTFQFETGKNLNLEKILYISHRMLQYSNFFLDAVIIDSTYGHNRFNMPLINIVGINSFGKTIILGFALLNNETTQSYDWVFKNFKNHWKRKPGFVITDECEATISSKFQRLFF